jgi:hypothetical protein
VETWLVGAQTLLLAVSALFTWLTIRDAGRERARERAAALLRDRQVKLDEIASAALAVYEAARGFTLYAAESHARLVTAQKRLEYALSLSGGLVQAEALALLVGEPLDRISDDLITAALEEVEEGWRGLRG